MESTTTDLAWLLPPRRLLREKSSAPVLLDEVDEVAAAPLTAALGRTLDITDEDGKVIPGEAVALNLALLPHLAIAGTSGSGKSTLLRTLLTSLLTVSTPDDLRLVLIDLDGEFEDLRGVPHLQQPPLDDTVESVEALEGLADELDRRRRLFHDNEVYNIDDYNALGFKVPRVLCVVDEFASMMLGGEKKRVEAAVAHIGMRGRKYGLHLILATQLPHANVLTPAIRANMKARIALSVPTVTFSRVALDQPGAEKLHGNGDALLKDGLHSGIKHFQSAWVSREVLQRIVEHWKAQGMPEPDPVWADMEDEDEVASPASPLSGGRIVRRGPRPVAYLATFAVASLVWLGVHGAVSSSPVCPHGTTELNTSIEDVCQYPSGNTLCTISAAGFSPNSGENDYSQNPPSGEWCRNAHDWQG